ncbi:beta-xylosidase [Pochonia chlamydosporia 170]|uniref:xylan 1,4-beta-xylosidase n=1 Tax=Pochonia chlamydosporia 170 TaxID=1380566 RepID=A0A179FAX4_METCM|nr:beta-xylosidase [Pochonia chlamydosporia 170]OAQ62460.1 beta-xylosidase [Pochonia chlamydosporia 170]
MLVIDGVHSRTCLPAYNAQISYSGCYSDFGDRRILQDQFMDLGSLNSPQYCADLCGSDGYEYSGVEYTTQCFCAHAIAESAQKIDESKCNAKCPGNSKISCGGNLAINVYAIKNPKNPPRSLMLADCTRQPLCSNDVCDTGKSIQDRAAALIKEMTLDEKIANSGSMDWFGPVAGVLRLGLPQYRWANEALHGVARGTTQFNTPFGANFSAATSFPMPISMGAAFDDSLINEVATTIGTEARAFANSGRMGFDYWTPNINPYRDPRWGRGQETPGEDSYHIQKYVYNYVSGLQGGVNPEVYKVLATCKHYAAYDIETGRFTIDVRPTLQDMAEYYLPIFRTCVRDAKAASIMCAYNAVNGSPACGSKYLLKDILRDHWSFNEPFNYVVSDCDAVHNTKFYADDVEGAAVSLNAGTDLDCGTTYPRNLHDSIASNGTTEATLDKSLNRLYSALIKVGYFNPPEQYNSLGWKDVNTTQAQQLAHRAATEGMVLLKNDGILPLSKNLSKVAVIGPWADATTEMQGSSGYRGIAPVPIISPLSAFQSHWSVVKYSRGTGINTENGEDLDAIEVAKASDYILYLGGIDGSIEDEGNDRLDIAWPRNQLDLVSKLSALGKPLIIVQFGGGQVDDSDLVKNSNVNAILWAGYPGQAGGNALFDVLTGVAPPAGRLPVTQYAASYINGNNIKDMTMRPSSGVPGRTYKWYTGEPVFPFGYGQHYTNFSISWQSTPSEASYNIGTLVKNTRGFKDLAKFVDLVVNVNNTGGNTNLSSDYVGLLFLSSNAGPSPRPIKQLAAYGRLYKISVGFTKQLKLTVNLGSLARADSNGDLYIYPGDYTLALDSDTKITWKFTLTGQATKIDTLPRQSP